MKAYSDAPLLFARSFLNNPLGVGALAPSSPRLSRLMASRVDAGEAPVLEVGAGTGVITRELIRQGVRPERLILIERDRDLAEFLRSQFPDVRVWCDDVLHCTRLLDRQSLGRARTVISSLPLRNLSSTDQLRTMSAMMSSLTRDGQLIQFTYAAGCPVPCRKLGLSAECLGRVWRNLPPAAVWRFTFA